MATNASTSANTNALKATRVKTLKELAAHEEGEKRFQGGHSLCAGCGVPLVVRTVLNAVDVPVIVVNATGCLEVASTRYPTTAWNVPWLHVAFENAAAAASGVETAFRMLRRKGLGAAELGFEPPDDVRVVAFGGDGGTYDIGLQALSGALERGHRFTYICYDNEGYMNTGIQRSSATPQGAWTTTTPEGYVEDRPKKDIVGILAAHRVPYVATASVAFPDDFIRKVQKAKAIRGTRFIHLLSPCPPGWNRLRGEHRDRAAGRPHEDLPALRDRGRQTVQDHRRA